MVPPARPRVGVDAPDSASLRRHLPLDTLADKHYVYVYTMWDWYNQGALS